MAGMLKVDSTPELAIREIEAILAKHKLTLRSDSQLILVSNEVSYYLRDIDMHCACFELPRLTEGERFVKMW